MRIEGEMPSALARCRWLQVLCAKSIRLGPYFALLLRGPWPGKYAVADSECIDTFRSYFNEISTRLARLVHSCKTEISVMNAISIDARLTLQTYKWWRSAERGQIMFAQNSFHLSAGECRVTVLILQCHPEVEAKLVILGEYRYHRNFENPPSQAQLLNMHFDIPSLFG